MYILLQYAYAHAHTYTHTLTQWLCVQEQWRQLEAVLTVPDTARAFRDEAVQFSQTTSSWLELMAAAAETPGVMQCCDGEVSRVQALDSLRERLERCKKSLTLYLLSKRQVSVVFVCLCLILCLLSVCLFLHYLFLFMFFVYYSCNNHRYYIPWYPCNHECLLL